MPSRELTPAQARDALLPETPASFAPSTVDEQQQLGALVDTLVTNARTDRELEDAPARARALGFHVEAWQVGDQRFWALLEAPEARRGAGAYVVRVGPATTGAEIVLQAPHTFYDLGTGDIAARLFFSSSAGAHVRALFVNTAHRYGGPRQAPPPGEHSDSDLCHITDHVFQDATRAAAEAVGATIVVQLHGFSDAPELPEAILSSGQREASSPLVHALSRELEPVLGKVRRYPEDIAKLGATTNTQGKLLAGYPDARFVHIELSAGTRDRLRDSDELMADFGEIALADRDLDGERIEHAPDADADVPRGAGAGEGAAPAPER
ncbi:hypothetical protein [Haliangium sp.]|uniref:hypothetical protein n=1 Tax=Haliangium sp. TaxID=2663208 RepID=UPI003D149E14